MPWSTPALNEVRGLVRDAIRAKLPGADANVPNSVLRVLSDTQGALCHLTLQYIDWLALQLLPDTAETEWLDRHGQIWLINSDGSKGRKLATLASGTATFQGTVNGTVIPAHTQLRSAVKMPLFAPMPFTDVMFETLEDITVWATLPVQGNVRAIDPGAFGNLEMGASLEIVGTIPGVTQTATVIVMTGGADEETDNELRYRVLRRIQQPPMGGAAYDYENWALAVPGVTRAWAAPQEMGIGTMTVRFMMDDLRADNDGVPLPEDVAAVQTYLDSKRPVTVKDCFVEAPLKYPIDVTIGNLNPNTAETQAQIEASVRAMLFEIAKPGQTIYAAWKSFAVMSAANVVSFDLTNADDDVMPSPGYMGVMGTLYAP